MNDWLLSIIGVVFMGVLFDIIYPNGKTNAVCRSIFGIIAIFVMMKPVFNFIKFDNVADNFIDKNLLLSIDESKCDYLESKIKSDLLSRGVDGVNVEIDGITEDNVFEIKNVYVDISEIVLSEDMMNINKYEVISNIILESVDIQKEGIIIYG